MNIDQAIDYPNTPLGDLELIKIARDLIDWRPDVNMPLENFQRLSDLHMATLLEVLATYSDRLKALDPALYLSLSYWL